MADEHAVVRRGAAADATGGPPGGRGGRLNVTEARQAAADVCAAIRGGDLLDAAFERRAGALDARDRRWTQELLWGMLRRRAWLDALLGARVRGGLARVDADLADLLRLGSYQLLFMGSVPAYAGIAQTVELAKRRHGIGASKLANAVLRRVDRERDALDVLLPADATEALALAQSHPLWLVQRWVERWGLEGAESLLRANNRESALIARPFGVVREQLETALEAAGVHVTDAQLVPDSLQLSGTGSLTELGAFRQGLFFMQDPAATLVTRYAAFPAGAVVADICAAPGGKTLELSRTAATVVAMDRSFTRLQRLESNVRRVDAPNVHAVVADAREPALAPVDAVLVDAPCTGTGTFRRHPDARWRLKVSDVPVMAALQRDILREAATIVRPGGLLVYATCSLEPEENDAHVDWFLAEHPGWTVEPPPAGTVPAPVRDGGRLRVLPQKHDTDGAFAVRFRSGGA
jgi:16S rRNA (cytosine967-C5)-methyltransferase